MFSRGRHASDEEEEEYGDQVGSKTFWRLCKNTLHHCSVLSALCFSAVQQGVIWKSHEASGKVFTTKAMKRVRLAARCYIHPAQATLRSSPYARGCRSGWLVPARWRASSTP